MKCMKCDKNLRSNNETGVCGICSKTFSEYRAWANMKARCLDKNHPAYDRYGGRGITVCPTWTSSFPNFYRDMSDRPSLNLSLDRKDNDSNYCKDNCRWATKGEQANNRRVCRAYKVMKNHSTGIKGVTSYGSGKFRSVYKRKYLGLSSTIGEAESKLKSHIESLKR